MQGNLMSCECFLLCDLNFGKPCMMSSLVALQRCLEAMIV
jgi:hypothetical protein